MPPSENQIRVARRRSWRRASAVSAARTWACARWFAVRDQSTAYSGTADSSSGKLRLIRTATTTGSSPCRGSGLNSRPCAFSITGPSLPPAKGAASAAITAGGNSFDHSCGS